MWGRTQSSAGTVCPSNPQYVVMYLLYRYKHIFITIFLIRWIFMFSSTEIDDMIRKSTNLLLTRTLSHCLQYAIKKKNVGLAEVRIFLFSVFICQHPCCSWLMMYQSSLNQRVCIWALWILLFCTGKLALNDKIISFYF